MKKLLQIAIDGPVAAGKGTVAKILAKKLGITFIDTGAMYRVAALLGLREGLDLKKDEEKLVELVKKINIRIESAPANKDIPCLVFLNGEDVSEEIRNLKVSWGSSVVATLPKLREVLVKKQQEMARGKNVIMEGRDITTRVLPAAPLKIYLTASQKERARRRFNQFRQKGVEITFQEALNETIKRDKQDTERKTDPLTIVPDAWVLDTTNLTVNQVVQKILEKIKEMEI